MGSFWSYLCFCSNCCKTNPKQNDKQLIEKEANNPMNKVSNNENPIKNDILDQFGDKQVKRVILDSNSDKISIISIANDNEEEEEEEEHLIIDEKKIQEELAHSMKGEEEEESYEKAMSRQKSLPLKEYNKFGLIDINSEHFSIVKILMNSRGYDLIESIGSGNYSEVYKALSRSKQKDVAIKVMDTIQIKHKYGIILLPREVNIVRKLNHKNVIKVYQMINTSNKICVVMELASNRSIADLMSKRGALSETMSWLLFVSILKGLDYMHSKKIAHRNLKLENILLSKNLIPKLSDFCFAIIKDENKQKSQISFISPYLSPEILQHLPYNPFISDIWSLGVCLHIIVSDSLPYKLGNEKEMLENQLIGEWNLPLTFESKLSKQLKTFIGYMLEPDITLRPTTKQLSKHNWILIEPKSEHNFTQND